MSAPIALFFDEAVPAFVKAIVEHFGSGSLERGLILRDTSGRLRFLSADPVPSEGARAAIAATIAETLGHYVRSDSSLAFCGEPGVESLLSDPAAFPMTEGGLSFRLLDRRIVGSAWMEPPSAQAAWPPRIVFASLKGGVGRSTAAAMVAADLSRRNRNVLVVDLDLEAPGLGDMLLDEERLPRYGSVDYFVENGLGGVPGERLYHFAGTSALTTGGGGRVDVIPALGTEAATHPGNTLAKLSRAMIEDIDSHGRSIPVIEQMSEMIQRFTKRDTYDVVLIDSRAGLSELAAPAILGLGATVLLFGTAQRQTIRGYKALFAALKLLAERERAAGGPAEWRLRFKAVHAKAGFDEGAAQRHRDDLYELFAENLYDAEIAPYDNPDATTFGIDDEDAPHWPLLIPFSQNLIDFDPVRAPSQLTVPFYEQVYRPFLNGVDSIIREISPAGLERGQ